MELAVALQLVGLDGEVERQQVRGDALVQRTQTHLHTARDIRYDTRCYFKVRSKADMSQLNLPHGNDMHTVRLQ